MRLKRLFSVPEKQKITEKYLRRVLICSICSIFLCMSCLTGVTWAWFSTSVENTGNEIQIGEPAITLTVDGEGFPSGTDLAAAEEPYALKLIHANQPDDLANKSTLYVTFTVVTPEKTIIRYVTLNDANGYEKEFRIQADAACKLSWVVSWFVPDNAEALEGDTLVVEAPPEPTTEPTTEPATEATEPSTEATESTTEATEPPESVEPEPTESVEPEPSESVEPEPSESVEPEPSESVEPEPSESVEPEPSESVEPEPSESVEPESSEGETT